MSSSKCEEEAQDDSSVVQEEAQENEDLTKLAKAVSIADVTIADLRKAAKTALARLMECLDNPQGGRTPTGARQYATVLGILVDKLEKKTADPRAERHDRLMSMTDEELWALIIQDTAEMPDDMWDRAVEARRKRKENGGDGADKAESSKKKRAKSKHWYQRETWESESE